MTLAVLAAAGICIGLLGIVVPVLPGLLLTWASAAAYAVAVALSPDGSDPWGWSLLAAVTIAYAVGLVVQQLLPARALKARGVPWTTIAVGVVVGIAGFFVVPVVGALVGFVGGVFLVELTRLRSLAAAWPSTVHALRAVGISMLIELTTGLVILSLWAGAVALGAR